MKQWQEQKQAHHAAGSIETPGFQLIEQLQAAVITECVDVYAFGPCACGIIWGEESLGRIQCHADIGKRCNGKRYIATGYQSSAIVCSAPG